ncbi:MAG: PAS domain-containing protein [Methanoregula sp.]|nr:PAS domain-containing protein [Methanoregula sp.]
MEGLLLKDISKQLEINRVSLSKYLATMVARGEIEYRSIGRAKLYTLTKRIPLENILGQTEDHVIITDNDGRVTQIDIRTAALFACPRELMIGKPIGEGSSCRFFSSDGAPLSTRQMTETRSGELLLYYGDQITCFQVKSIPVVLNDGSRGNACILTDITEKKQVEKNLRETTEYLNNLLNYANAPIIVWDPGFRITRFNHAFEHLTGRTEREVLGQSLDILFPAESRDTSLALIKRTLNGEHWETVEIPIISNDGSVQTVLWNSANVLGKDGKIISTIAQGVDITEHKLAERNLRESEEKYRNIFMNSVEGIFWLTPEGRFISANPAAARMLGYDLPDELIGAVKDIGVQVYFDPDDFIRLTSLLKKEGVLKNYEVKCRNKNGNSIWGMLNVHVVRDVQGNIVFFEGTCQDITERKRIEEALKHSEEKYRHLVETMNEGLLAVDKNCIITFVNNRYCEMVGYSRDELIGKSSVMLIAPECTNIALAQWDLRVRGNSESYPINLIRKDGQKINALAVARPVYDENGQLNGSLIIVTDLIPLEKPLYKVDEARHVQQ